MLRDLNETIFRQSESARFSYPDWLYFRISIQEETPNPTPRGTPRGMPAYAGFGVGTGFRQVLMACSHGCWPVRWPRKHSPMNNSRAYFPAVFHYSPLRGIEPSTFVSLGRAAQRS